VRVDFLDHGFEFRGVARPDVNHESSEDAGFANELGKGFRVCWHFAAKVGATNTELGASTDETIALVVENFLRAFLAEGFVDRSHEGVVALVHVGVTLTLGNEN